MKKAHTEKCLICKNTFKVRLSWVHTVKTCSKACSAQYKSSWSKGRKMDSVWREKIGKANAIALLGKTTSQKQKDTAKANWTAEKNPRWNGGIKKSYRIRKKNAEGSHSKIQWEALKARFQYMCLCCKRQEPDIKLSEDHIIPLSKGGSDFIENIQPLCLLCNKRKGVQDIDFISPYFADRQKITVANS